MEHRINSPEARKSYLVAVLLKFVGWVLLFAINWKMGLALFSLEVGKRIESDLHFRSHMGIIENILSSLGSLIKKDNVTEESKSVKNN